MRTVITQLTVAPEEGPLVCKESTTITAVDEGAGLFARIEQLDPYGEIRIDPEEWPVIRQAIDEIIFTCNQENKARP